MKLSSQTMVYVHIATWGKDVGQHERDEFGISLNKFG
jgi:hypothetical protein